MTYDLTAGKNWLSTFISGVKEEREHTKEKQSSFQNCYGRKTDTGLSLTPLIRTKYIN